MVRVRLASASYSRTSDSTCSRTSFCSIGSGESAVLLPLPMRYERPKSTKGTSAPLTVVIDQLRIKSTVAGDYVNEPIARTPII